MKRIIPVNIRSIRSRSYKVQVEHGLLKRLPSIIARQWPGRTVFVITDSNVRRLYGSSLLRDLMVRGVEAMLLDFPPGEQSKSADVVISLHTHLLRNGIARDSLIVALGGGVVGDVAGFVAATVLRGVDFVQAPTTLLAQVDSSVGGKVGIDHAVGKNLIGAFHQPAAVFIDPRVLSTLPAAEYRNGLAEIVKIAAALDPKFFRRLERHRRGIADMNQRALADIIARSITLKAAVVERDEFDRALRKTLNLGHTLGHALEAGSGYAIRHGEAVAAGLAGESRIALEMGLLPASDYRRLLRLLVALRLPSRFPKIANRSKFYAALSLDKKSDQGVSRFVLLKGIGRAVIGVEVPTPFVSALVEGAR